MMISKPHSPTWHDAAHAAIQLRISIDGRVGEFDFVATPNDVEAHGRELFARAVAGEFGAIAPYVAPAPMVPKVVTMRQARIALHRAGHLTTVQAAMPSLGAEAEIEWEYATEVHRDSALVVAMAQLLSLDAGALDALFVSAAGIA